VHYSGALAQGLERRIAVYFYAFWIGIGLNWASFEVLLTIYHHICDLFPIGLARIAEYLRDFFFFSSISLHLHL